MVFIPSKTDTNEKSCEKYPIFRFENLVTRFVFDFPIRGGALFKIQYNTHSKGNFYRTPGIELANEKTNARETTGTKKDARTANCSAGHDFPPPQRPKKAPAKQQDEFVVLAPNLTRKTAQISDFQNPRYGN